MSDSENFARLAVFVFQRQTHVRLAKLKQTQRQQKNRTLATATAWRVADVANDNSFSLNEMKM